MHIFYFQNTIRNNAYIFLPKLQENIKRGVADLIAFVVFPREVNKGSKFIIYSHPIKTDRFA